jgi:hypothetical protein
VFTATIFTEWWLVFDSFHSPVTSVHHPIVAGEALDVIGWLVRSSAAIYYFKIGGFSTYHRLWGGDTCHHPITTWNSPPSPPQETRQSNPFHILVDQECNYTDSHSSESKRDKLESGERKLERVANVNTS